MNIVYVSREFGPVTGGGIGTYIANVSRAFAAAGHRVFLLTDCLTEAHKNLLPNGVELIKTEDSLPQQKGQFFTECQEYSYRVLNTLRILAQREKLDVIEFADYRGEGFATIRAKRLLNEFADAKLIVKCHTPCSLLFEINEAKSLSATLLCDFEIEDYCVRHADLVTSPSSALAQYFQERLARSDIRLCPYPMHLPPLSGPRTFHPPQTKTVRFLGSIQVRKGVDYFIAAAIRVLQADPDFRFEIYGLDRNEHYFGQPYGEFLAAQIPGPYKEKIRFAGAIQYDAIPGLLRDSCFCVFPSRWENWANVCLEAMSMGCVVIASNRGGMAEMIEDGKSGFLVAPSDVEEMARLILCHHKDLSRLDQISAAACARSRAIADPDVARQRILENYQLPAPSRPWVSRPSPKVSVVIPFFNQGEFLEEAIDSVNRSTYRNVEIIVVNDGSTDTASNGVFERTQGVVKIQKQNGGLSSARNAGIHAATGDYLLMLDGDDKIHGEYISTAVQALDNNPGISYLTCHAQNFGAFDSTYIPVGFVPCLMPFMNTDGKCANMYRREVFAACGGYDERLVSYEDWDFLLALRGAGLEGDVLPAEFFYYRRRYNSMVYTVANPKRMELIQFMMLKHRKLLSKDAPLMAVVLAGLWKQTEISVENLSEQLGRRLGDHSGTREAPVRTKEVIRMLKRYGKRKLGWLNPASLRAS